MIPTILHVAYREGGKGPGPDSKGKTSLTDQTSKRDMQANKGSSATKLLESLLAIWHMGITPNWRGTSCI